MKKTILIFTMMLFISGLAFALDEGFEGGVIPGDWTVIDADGDGLQWVAFENVIAHSGNWVAVVEAYSSDDGDDWLITPQVTIQDGDSFSFFARSWYGTEDMNVKLSTSGNSIGDFDVTLESVTGLGDSWVEYSYDLSSYAGQDIYLAIQWNVDTYALVVDDVTIGGGTQPTCPDPSALYATNILQTQADFGWAENGEATVWNIEVGAPGFTPGTSTYIQAYTGVEFNPYSGTGLTASTDYEFYVQADCGEGDISNWAGPEAFTTPDEIPTCSDPSDLATSGITLTTADLNWTENGFATSWDIELGTAGFAPTGTPTATGVTNPYTYGTLSFGTSYDWYVHADCGGGDYSNWIGPCTFVTLCDSYTAPFSENFDTTTLEEMPDCWHRIEGNSFGYVKVSDVVSNSAPNNLRMYNSASTTDAFIAVTPKFSDLTSQLNRIRFYARSSDSCDLIIGTMSDPTDELTFTPYNTINLTPDYIGYKVVFGVGYTGSDEYIAFKHGCNTTYDYLNIDDFVYEADPYGGLEPGTGSGTSINGECVFIDVIPIDFGLGDINPDVTFCPEFGPITVDVVVLENTLQVGDPVKGRFPLSYALYFTGDTDQTFNMILSFEGWYHGSPSSIYYWDGLIWTYPDNIIFGTTEVAFDITPPAGTDAYEFHLKNKPQPDDGDDILPFTHNNYPNPFNPVTNIAFSLSEAGFVTLEIYNIKGQKVKSLVNEKLDAGAHQVLWNGKEESGKSASSGVYFYKIKAGNFEQTKKMILLK